MKRGDRLEGALWFNAYSPDDRDKAKEGVSRVIRETAEMYGAIIGDILWTDLDPEDGRLPEPPDHMQGKAKCLLGEADIKGFLPVLEAAGRPFVDDLEPRDLERLRAVTRRNMPGNPTQDEVDDVIEQIGPDAAGALISGTVH